jgi:hypothetical protein
MSDCFEETDFVPLQTDPGIRPNLNLYANHRKSSAFLMIENQMNFVSEDFFQEIIELENKFADFSEIEDIHKIINMYKV